MSCKYLVKLQRITLAEHLHQVELILVKMLAIIQYKIKTEIEIYLLPKQHNQLLRTPIQTLIEPLATI